MSIENVVQIVPTVAEVAPIDISGTCVLAAFTQGKFSGKRSSSSNQRYYGYVTTVYRNQ